MNPFVIAGIVAVIGAIIITLVLVLRKKSNNDEKKPEPVKDVGVSKPGNNGAVSCQTYCTGNYGDLPVYKKAVSAKLDRTGESIDVTKVLGSALVPGTDPNNPLNYGYNGLTCMCSNN